MEERSLLYGPTKIGKIMVSVLLLDTTYEPLRVLTWKKAVMMLFNGKAEVVEESDREVRTASSTFRLPSVIRQLMKYKRKGKVNFSRINVYLRDGWTCQYCGSKRPTHELTFDHVLPRAQGGKTTWTNIVTACKPCNHAKEDRTPEQARMKLVRPPIEPKWLPAQMVIKLKTLPKEWESYIDARSMMYWTTELESG